MNITIVGGGNIGTQFAVHCAAKGHNVTIYTPKYELFEKKLEIVDSLGNFILSAEIELATNNASQAFGKADLIFVTVPSFLSYKLYQEIESYIQPKTLIGIIPGNGGMECAFSECLKKECVIFGLQRVPSVARLLVYGKRVCAEGYREKLHVAALPCAKTNLCAKLISEIFDMPCESLPNYLNLTLTPSNPILHTTRLFTLFKDYYNGKVYEYVPLFYEDWTDETSKLLLKCDAEVQSICKKLKDFDLSYVKSLKEHYESETAQQLTKKIRNIKAFKGIKTPTLTVENGVVPDFSSRYFIADFAYGLTIIKQIAEFVQVNTPNIDKLLIWYKNITNTEDYFDFSDYKIDDLKSFKNLYSI